MTKECTGAQLKTCIAVALGRKTCLCRFHFTRTRLINQSEILAFPSKELGISQASNFAVEIGWIITI